MKYILLSLLFVLGGCSAIGGTVGDTSDYESPLLDPNVLICPADTFKACSGPNRNMLTCECVRNVRIQQLDLSLGGYPY
jgi:hypothetical protein